MGYPSKLDLPSPDPPFEPVFDVSVGDIKIQNLERFPQGLGYYCWLGRIWVLVERARNQPFCLKNSDHLLTTDHVAGTVLLAFICFISKASQ